MCPLVHLSPQVLVFDHQRNQQDFVVESIFILPTWKMRHTTRILRKKVSKFSQYYSEEKALSYGVDS